MRRAGRSTPRASPIGWGFSPRSSKSASSSRCCSASPASRSTSASTGAVGTGRGRVRFLDDTVGFELFFPFAQEVDRYAAEPAGFAGDSAVALTLMDLAHRRTDIRAFHDRVLNRGPLSVEALQSIA
jgi:hypothetical protein